MSEFQDKIENEIENLEKQLRVKKMFLKEVTKKKTLKFHERNIGNHFYKMMAKYAPDYSKVKENAILILTNPKGHELIEMEAKAGAFLGKISGMKKEDNNAASYAMEAAQYVMSLESLSSTDHHLLRKLEERVQTLRPKIDDNRKQLMEKLLQESFSLMLVEE